MFEDFKRKSDEQRNVTVSGLGKGFLLLSMLLWCLAAILYKKDGEDMNILGFASKLLKQCEMSYTISELELLSLVHEVRK